MQKSFFILVALLLLGAATHAQMVTSVGLVLQMDSTANVLMPRIVKILPNTAAEAEPEITVGMFLIKVDDTYCRNASLKKIVDIINNGDEEGTPVSLTIGDDKDKVPIYPFVMRRGRPVGKD